MPCCTGRQQGRHEGRRRRNLASRHRESDLQCLVVQATSTIWGAAASKSHPTVRPCYSLTDLSLRREACLAPGTEAMHWFVLLSSGIPLLPFVADCRHRRQQWRGRRLCHQHPHHVRRAATLIWCLTRLQPCLRQRACRGVVQFAHPEKRLSDCFDALLSRGLRLERTLPVRGFFSGHQVLKLLVGCRGLRLEGTLPVKEFCAFHYLREWDVDNANFTGGLDHSTAEESGIGQIS